VNQVTSEAIALALTPTQEQAAELVGMSLSAPRQWTAGGVIGRECIVSEERGARV
jgi:hypothetical protein